ncbi:MAG: hypothetical protein ACO1NO_05555 [Burkholderiaceae bacterium]
MAKEEHMNLQHSESLVAQMAATIFAGLIQKHGYSSATEEEFIGLSTSIAIKLATRTEKLVKSDQEWLKNETSSAYLVG